MAVVVESVDCRWSDVSSVVSDALCVEDLPGSMLVEPVCDLRLMMFVVSVPDIWEVVC